MAACDVCERTEGLFWLGRRTPSGAMETARRYCTACWASVEPDARHLLAADGWTLQMRDPDVTEMDPEAVRYLLELERVAQPAELRAAALGVVDFARQTGEPLSRALAGFVRRQLAG